jgi:hypothetical protein
MMEDNVDEVVNNEVENVENKSNSITEKIMLGNMGCRIFKGGIQHKISRFLITSIYRLYCLK